MLLRLVSLTKTSTIVPTLSMGTIPIPQEIMEQAECLVAGVLTSVQLKCAGLRENVVTTVATLLERKPASLRSRTPENTAKRVVYLANYSFDKAQREHYEGEDDVASARSHFHSQVFTRSFP